MRLDGARCFAHNSFMPRKALELWRKACWWLIYKGPRREVTIQTTNGLLTVDSKDWLVGKYLYVRRSHEEHEIRSAVALLRSEGYLSGARGKTLLNVGANIGMTCIGALKAGYFERAIAFEPAPENYRLLVQNIAQNEMQRQIDHFPFALSSVNGDLELELSNDNSGDHRIRQTNRPGFFQEEKRRLLRVPAKTLDQALVEFPNLANAPVNLVWVDIQGHEGHFFEGARHFLSRGIPVVSEFWPYGIQRSGKPIPEFRRVLSELFTHFYVLAGAPSEKRPISEIARLFDSYSSPREMCLIVLVRDQE
jgi:FkbM family methyltransferase